MPVRKLLMGLFIALIILLYFVGGAARYLDIRLYQDLFQRSSYVDLA